MSGCGQVTERRSSRLTVLLLQGRRPTLLLERNPAWQVPACWRRSAYMTHCENGSPTTHLIRRAFTHAGSVIPYTPGFTANLSRSMYLGPTSRSHP